MLASVCISKIRWLRSVLDPEDLAQDIWINLVTGTLDWRRFPTPDHLRRYLVRAVCNKIRNAVRDHLGAQKRAAHRCHYLSDADAGVAAGVVADPSPTPAWTVEMRDECDRILSFLTDAQRQAAHMMGLGFSPAEIATKLRCSERTVERMVGKIRQAVSSV